MFDEEIIGQPTLVADHPAPEAGVVLHTETACSARVAWRPAQTPTSTDQRGQDPGHHTGAPDAIPAVGGAMELAIVAKSVFVMMNLFAKDGTAKIVPTCTYPLTGLRCARRVYTEYAVFDIDSDGVRVRDTFGISVSDLRARIAIELS